MTTVGPGHPGVHFFLEVAPEVLVRRIDARTPSRTIPPGRTGAGVVQGPHRGVDGAVDTLPGDTVFLDGESASRVLAHNG